MTNKSKQQAADVAVLFRARNPFLWVVTREEARVERYLFEAALSVRYTPRTWDVAQGFANLDGTTIPGYGKGEGFTDPGEAIDLIAACARGNNFERKAPGKGVWIMRDLPAWLAPPAGLVTLRQLRSLARLLPTVPPERAQAIVVITPIAEVPAELANHATVIEWPLPDRQEIADLLTEAVEVLPEEVRGKALPEDVRDAAVDAAVGLTGEEAISCYAKSLVQTKCIDPAVVAREKKRVIARERVLEWYDPLPGGLDAVGGLANLKAWLAMRAQAYSKQAREYGLPAPKGALLVGIPGTGKSLTAKAIATAWGVPLLKLDLGALKSKFVGDSEANIRKAFRVIEAIGRCVVWVDEIEKALAGATQGAADGGVSSDALGSILSWMQERQGEAFVLATANDVSQLPPELMRKGRFDEIWFVDVPTAAERVEVLKAAMAAHGRVDLRINYKEVAAACEGFTGAELAALVPEALFAAFAENEREPATRDLLTAASTVVPLIRTASAKVEALRQWQASGGARPANAVEERSRLPTVGRAGRMVDL